VQYKQKLNNKLNWIDIETPITNETGMQLSQQLLLQLSKLGVMDKVKTMIVLMQCVEWHHGKRTRPSYLHFRVSVQNNELNNTRIKGGKKRKLIERGK
jgi:hypothetical protein